MLYVDIPTAAELLQLAESRGGPHVSIWLATTPITQDAQADRIEIRNLTRAALEQLAAVKTPKKEIDSIADQLGDLADDNDFWARQARGLVVYATPGRSRTFRLPNHLQPGLEVADRFQIKPLLRAVSFPQHAYVLVFSENGVSLRDVHHGVPAMEIRVPDLPRDAASAVGKSSINDPSPSGRIQGKEGQKVRLRQYARKVDAAIRPVLTGHSTPLIVAATDELAAIYREVNSYPHLAAGHIKGNPDRMTPGELEAGARQELDRINAAVVSGVREQYELRSRDGRATSQVADAARSATFGAVETLLVDLDREIPGTVSEEDGRVDFADSPSANTYDVLDEIACRVLRTGGRVLAVRKEELPFDSGIAAVLRYRV